LLHCGRLGAAQKRRRIYLTAWPELSKTDIRGTATPKEGAATLRGSGNIRMGEHGAKRSARASLVEQNLSNVLTRPIDGIINVTFGFWVL
jgi:hypothetical protein